MIKLNKENHRASGLFTVICSQLVVCIICIVMPVTHWQQFIAISVIFQCQALVPIIAFYHWHQWIMQKPITMIITWLLIIMVGISGIVTLSLMLLSQNYPSLVLYPLDTLFPGISHVTISSILGLIIAYSLYCQHHSVEQQQIISSAMIEALQARIRPHFLFNSMNTIAELIRQDPQLAENLVIDMAELFRSSLRTKAVMVPLSEEVSLCKKYAHIEKLRLGQRLAVEWSMPEALEGEIPLFSLQPILENAVYHGIQTTPDGGVIHIKIKQYKKRQNTVFKVVNPVGEKQVSVRGSGMKIAQDNLKQRLAVLYGDKALYRAHSDGKCYTVKLIIPNESSIYDESITR